MFKFRSDSTPGRPALSKQGFGMKGCGIALASGCTWKPEGKHFIGTAVQFQRFSTLSLWQEAGHHGTNNVAGEEAESSTS